MKKLISRLTVLLFSWVLSGPTALPAADVGASDAPAGDVLVYQDGDRIRGRLVEQTADMLVFQSERFGLLRVPVGKAVVIKLIKSGERVSLATISSPPPAAPVGNLQSAAEHADVEKVSGWERWSPLVLTTKLAEFFGPWHGKIGFSTEVVSDTAERNNLALETLLQRKWKSDEVQFKARYDYSKTNELTTTDLIKADALWRHDFPKSRFALYRPTLEWNRASFSKTRVPTDYVLIQQEIGFGLSLLSTPARKLRLGLSENLFDVWNTAPVTVHTSRTVESAFLEAELKLPWRMSLSERAVYYYSIASATAGWENRIELSKKFTETLSTSVRHEIRRDNPDGRAPDYSRLKLLFGLDF